MGAELFYADGRTDLTKLIVTFRNFAKAYKNARHFDIASRCAFIVWCLYARTQCFVSKTVKGKDHFENSASQFVNNHGITL